MLVDPSLPLSPLQASFAENDLEVELKQLFIELYKDSLADKDGEIDVLGMPHLGSVDLIRLNMRQDGLAMKSDSDEARMRYLLKAWRYLNRERGTSFLRLYLKVLYDNSYSVDQLWQHKAKPYTSTGSLKTPAEIARDGESETNYFLTSRLRVDLDIDSALIDSMIQSIRSVLAARFVLDLRIAKFFQTAAGLGVVSRGYSVARFDGEAQTKSYGSEEQCGYYAIFSNASSAYLSGQ